MDLLPYTVQYSGSVFLVGFLLEIVRNKWAILLFDETTVLLYELPIVLFASWVAWKFVRKAIESVYVIECEGDFCRRERRKLTTNDVLMAGIVSFLYIKIYEFVLSKLLSGETLISFITKQLVFPKTISLAGQVAFGCVPWLNFLLQRQRDKHD